MNHQVYTIILSAIFWAGSSGCKKSDCGSGDNDLASIIISFSFFDIDTSESLVIGRGAVLDPDLFDFSPNGSDYIYKHSQGYFLLDILYAGSGITYESFEIAYADTISIGLMEIYLEEPNCKTGDSGADLYFEGELVCEDCRSDGNIYRLKIEKPSTQTII